MSASASVCPECGAALRGRLGRGLCPRCVLRVTLADEPASGDSESTVNAQRFGDYELIRELGRGGMGVVYEARHLSLNRTVALKMLHPSRLSSAAQLQRFRQEAEAVAALDHPNILPVYEVGSVQGQPYFTMKLAEGGALAGRIANFKSHLSNRDAVSLLAATARAVHYAHQRGIQHRDLKPHNILLDAGGRPYVSDFGLAKFAGRDSSLTLSTDVIGSPAYMSPEQAVGDTKYLTTASDVYGLGAILFELLSGRPPFAAENVPALLLKIVEEEPDASALKDNDLRTVCLKCLSKDPRQRYSSAEALADELERWRRGEPILARPISGLERFWRWCRRRPALAALGASVVVLLLTVTVVSTVSAIRVSTARQTALQANEQLTAANTRLNESVRNLDDSNARLNTTVSELELGRVEQLFTSGDSAAALARLGRILRDSPTNHIAAEYLLNSILREKLARPAAPPLRHIREVESARFSHDGRFLVTSSMDGSARIWSVPSGGMTFELRHSENFLTRIKGDAEVLQAEFSPDDRYVATADGNGEARLWDKASGQLLAGPLHPPGRLAAFHQKAKRWGCRVMFSPDGRWLAAGGDSSTNAAIWSVPAGERRCAIDAYGSAVSAIQFSPDGTTLAIGSARGVVGVCDAVSGAQRLRLDQGATVLAISFSPDGARLLASGMNGEAHVWSVSSGALELTLRHERGQGVNSAEFSSDGARILTASDDRTAAVWNATNGQRLCTVRHSDDIIMAKFSPDGRRVVTASSDYSARVWNATTGGLLAQPLRHAGRVRLADFSPDGSRVVTASYDREARVWNLDEDRTRPVTTKISSRAALTQATFSPDESQFATASESGTVVWWRSSDGTALRDGVRHSSPLRMVRYSPDGRCVAVTSRDGEIRILDCTTHNQLSVFKHEGDVNDVQFSPDGRHLATTARDGTARVWELATGLEVRRITSRLPMYIARFSRDGTRLLVGGDEEPGRVLNWRTGEEEPIHIFHPGGGMMDGEFSPDGMLVAIGSGNDTARVWDTRTGRPVSEPLQHRRSVRRARFSRDGTMLATASHDGTACLWNPRTGAMIARPLVHTDRVADISWSADGRRIATASWDGTARVWDTSTGLPVTGPLVHPGRAASVQLSADGSRALTACADGQARVWAVPRLTNAPPSWLPLLAEAAAGQRFTPQGETQILSWNEHEQIRSAIESGDDDSVASQVARWFFGRREGKQAAPFSQPGR